SGLRQAELPPSRDASDLFDFPILHPALPDPLAGQAIIVTVVLCEDDGREIGRLPLRRQYGRAVTRKFKYELAPNCFGKLIPRIDGDHEAPGTADDTTGIVDVEVLYGPVRVEITPRHQWKAIDHNSGGHGGIARVFHRAPIVVCPVAGNIDHFP